MRFAPPSRRTPRDPFWVDMKRRLPAESGSREARNGMPDSVSRLMLGLPAMSWIAGTEKEDGKNELQADSGV